MDRWRHRGLDRSRQQFTSWSDWSTVALDPSQQLCTITFSDGARFTLYPLSVIYKIGAGRSFIYYWIQIFLEKKTFGKQFIFSFVHPLSVLEDGVYSDPLLYSLSRGVSVVLSPIFVLQVQCIGNFGERLRLNTPPMRPFAKCTRAWKSTFALLIYKMYLFALVYSFEIFI